MRITQDKSALLLLLALLTLCWSSSWCQDLSFQLSGDTTSGYQVDVISDDRIILTSPGEFSIRLTNLDGSEDITIDAWKGSSWEGDHTRLKLFAESYIPEMDLDIRAIVEYELIQSGLIKKTIQLVQTCIPQLYYTVEIKGQPATLPEKYVTFEYDDFPGGLVHEIYPSAGFVTHDQKVVGFLTDAGYINQYTRTTRRRFNGHGGGFVGMRQLPDPALISVADSSERAEGNHFVKWTFGDLYDLDGGEEKLMKIESPLSGAVNTSLIREENKITLHSFPSQGSGMEFIAPFEDQQIYTLSFLIRGKSAVSVKLFRLKNGIKTVELEHGIKYIDHFPVQEDKWTLFKGSIFVPYIENDSVSIWIGTQADSSEIVQLKDLKIVKHQPERRPYNIMPMGDTVKKVVYLFEEPWRGHREFMISSQLRLAEGKGFEGSFAEKMLYANYQMHNWITSVRNFNPFAVPNMNYAPDMYNRDAFFSTVSTYDRELNLGIWEQWGKTQTSEGAIATIITPYMGSVETKGNEATMHWLVWAMLNQRRFGIKTERKRIRKAVAYVLDEFDEDRDGICRSHFSLNQVDIVDFQPKTDRLAVNQGMFAITLRTIRELGFDIPDAYIEKAEQGYRQFYDRNRKHLLFDRSFPDIISLTDLEPEFFSLWLFDRPILSDEMVIHHLEQIPRFNFSSAAPHPEYGTTAPICIRLTDDARGYAYLSPDYQPFGSFGETGYVDGQRDGVYYNGGSWLRAEYCAYVVGLRHGWDKAPYMMENRLWAEWNLKPEWPFSKEFIPTKWSTTDSWWRSTRGLTWNVFILMANEVAGLRSPDMDPSFGK